VLTASDIRASRGLYSRLCRSSRRTRLCLLYSALEASHNYLPRQVEGYQLLRSAERWKVFWKLLTTAALRGAPWNWTGIRCQRPTRLTFFWNLLFFCQCTLLYRARKNTSFTEHTSYISKGLYIIFNNWRTDQNTIIFELFCWKYKP
jgi:hypothetical protein